MLTLQVNTLTYVLSNCFKFSGGELQIRLPDMNVKCGDTIYVNTILNSSDAIMEMMLVDDALYHEYGNEDVRIILVANYLPYARQDRVCYKGEACSSDVLRNILESTNFDYIHFADIHSPQTFSKRFVEYTQLSIFENNPFIMDDVDVVISPDKGATKKAKAIAEHFNVPVSQSSKIRNPDTGELTQITIDDTVDLTDKTLMIVDDICDGGGTFIWTAKELLKHKPKSIKLYVTHGIFSRGVECIIDGGIDHIYTTDSIYGANSGVMTKTKLSIIKL